MEAIEFYLVEFSNLAWGPPLLILLMGGGFSGSFSAYGVTRDMDDPVSKALHGLLDHSVETDRRLQAIISRLEAAGVKLDESMASGDDFDAGKLSKLVD